MARRTKYELEKELEGLSDTLDRLQALQAKGGERERDQKSKISKLKDVARFYRAQRDRVDAYLSSMIDAAELRSRPEMYTGDKGTTDAFEVVPEPPSPAYGRRPNIQEPSSRNEDDGRRFAPYRDHEPEENWEDF